MSAVHPGQHQHYAEEYYSEEEVLEEEEVEEEEYYEEEIIEDDDDDDDDGAAPPSGGMAAMIAAAASKRNQRIDDGGPKKITEVKKAPPKVDTSSMAAMVASRANARNERVEAGGEVKVREIPQEHKNVFMSVAAEAANVGNLVKLREHAVEAVAAKKEEEVWGGPGGLRTDNIRSQMFMVINEAAALGAMRRLKPVETTNYDNTGFDEEEEDLPDVDKLTDDYGRRVVRTEYLLDLAVEEEKREKKQAWAAENQGTHYSSIDEVVLPSRKTPGFKPKKTQMTQKETMDAIALAVAERAWERNYRLNRPKANLRVTRKCSCKFCYNPNPFQTHKYKQIQDAGLTEAAPTDKVEEKLETSSTHKKWEPPKRTPPPPDFRGLTTTKDLKPVGERKLRAVVKPVPLPNRPADQRFRPTPTPLPSRAPAPAPPPTPPPPPQPEPQPTAAEQAQWEEGDDSDGDGPRVLLDETVTFGHKRIKSKPKDKDKKKKKKKKKKKDCVIM